MLQQLHIQFGWICFLTSVLSISWEGGPTFCFSEQPFSHGSILGLVFLFSSSLGRLCYTELAMSVVQFCLSFTPGICLHPRGSNKCQQTLITPDPSCIFCRGIFWVAFQVQLVPPAVKARMGYVQFCSCFQFQLNFTMLVLFSRHLKIQLCSAPLLPCCLLCLYTRISSVLFLRLRNAFGCFCWWH